MASARFWRVSLDLASAMKLIKSLAHGRTYGFEPFLQRAVGFENLSEFGRQIDDEFAEIGGELDERPLPCADTGAGLHLLIHDQDMSLAFGGGNERGLEGESVDLAEDTAALPHRPGLFEVDGKAGDDPTKRGAGGFERGAKGFGEFVVHGAGDSSLADFDGVLAN